MFKFIKSLWWFISKNWYHYIAILIVGLLLPILNLAPAAIVKLLIDAVGKEDNITMAFFIMVYYSSLCSNDAINLCSCNDKETITKSPKD